LVNSTQRMTRRVTRSVGIHPYLASRRATLSLVFVDGRLASAYRYSRKSPRLTAIIRATKHEQAGSALNCCARRCRLQCSFLRLALLFAAREWIGGKKWAGTLRAH